MISLTVNGKPHEHHGDGTLPALLAELGADPERVAVLHNGQIVRAPERASCRLHAGDLVELLVFAGGG